MKTGRTLSELAQELTRQATSKKDYVADTRALQTRAFDNSGTPQVILDGVGGGLPLRQTAHEQMSSTLGIPKSYYDRLLNQAPDLLVKNINHWLLATPSRKLVRTLDGGVRAILSDRYRPLDNLDLAEAVLPKLESLGATVLSGEVTEKRFYLKAVTPKISGEVKKDDIIQAGLVVSNSEIGAGALKIEEMSYRLICLNGAIHEQAVRRTHTGRKSSYSESELLEHSREFFRDETRAADDRAFFLKVQDTVSHTLSPLRFNNLLNTMRLASGEKLEEDPVKVVEITAKHFGLGEQERGSILKHLIQGGDLSKFGLANAVTRASQDVTDYDLATTMEEAGGQVLELPVSVWKN